MKHVGFKGSSQSDMEGGITNTVCLAAGVGFVVDWKKELPFSG